MPPMTVTSPYTRQSEDKKMPYATIEEAIENRPDSSCSVVRSHRGLYYAIANLSANTASVWILKPSRGGGYSWMTDYSKDSDFANMLFNKVEDQSVPAYCDKGYVVVVLENNVELKFWYQELHDAMRWLWSVTVELATEPFEALRIDSFDGQWILS